MWRSCGAGCGKHYIKQVGEVTGQPRFGQIVDSIVEISADAANSPGVGTDGLRLQALELKVFEMGLVIVVEI